METSPQGCHQFLDQRLRTIFLLNLCLAIYKIIIFQPASSIIVLTTLQCLKRIWWHSVCMLQCPRTTSRWEKRQGVQPGRGRGRGQQDAWPFLFIFSLAVRWLRPPLARLVLGSYSWGILVRAGTEMDHFQVTVRMLIYRHRFDFRSNGYPSPKNDLANPRNSCN